MTTRPLLRPDPTRTATLRRAFQVEVGKRFSALRTRLSGPGRPEEVDGLEAMLLSFLTSPDGWWDRFILRAYALGASRAYTARLERKGVPFSEEGLREFLLSLDRSPDERAAVTPGPAPTTNARPRKSKLPPRDLIGRFMSRKAKALSQRLKTEMRGVATWGAQQMARVILDGQDRGLTPKQVARELRKVVDMSKTRAVRVARTEMVRAYNEGVLDGLKALGDTEVTPMVEWTTSGAPCPRCGDMDGQRFTIDDARGVLPLHPNCLCAWSEVPGEAPSGEEDRDEFDLDRGAEEAPPSAGSQPPAPTTRDRPARSVPLETVRRRLDEAVKPGMNFDDAVAARQAAMREFIARRAGPVGPVKEHGMSEAEGHDGVRIGGVLFTWRSGSGPTEEVVASVRRAVDPRLPESVYKVNKQVTFTDQKNRHDEYWSKAYGIKDMVSSATGGGGKVVVYNGKEMEFGTFVHETGHNLATKLWGSPTPRPLSMYSQTQKIEGPVTEYGAKSPAEDFAEAVKGYFGSNWTRTQMKKDFPNKVRALEYHVGQLSKGGK